MTPNADGSAPSFGLRAMEAPVKLMAQPHAHSDLELNYVLAGTMTYFVGGRFERVEHGRLAAFWAAMPHRVVERDPGCRQVWVTVPLTTLLRWRISEGVVQKVLRGRLLVDTAVGRPGDGESFRRWAEDLASADLSLRHAAALEIEARLVRFAAEISRARPTRTEAGVGSAMNAAFERFVAVLHARYTEPVSLAELTAGLGVAPVYAGQLFRRLSGMTPIEYRARLRVAHAQRLLVLGDASMTDVALESGFGSVNRFYAAFHEFVGCTPREYRLRLSGKA